MDARARDERERLAELAQLVVREPNSIPHRLDLAMALLNVGRRDEAVGLFRDIALAYADSGQLVQSMAGCRGILEIDPAHDETLSLLSRLVERRGGRGASRLLAEDYEGTTIDAEAESEDEKKERLDGERTPVDAQSALREPIDDRLMTPAD